MRSRVAVACGLTLLTTGHATRVVRTTTSGSYESSIREMRTKGLALYAAGNFLQAERTFQHGYELARRAGNKAAPFFVNSVGVTRFAMFQYKPAMQAFLKARRLARQAGDSETVAVVSSNLSSLYLQQNEFNAGAGAAEEALAALRWAGPMKMGALLRTQCAILRSREGRFDAALPLFQQALDEAEARGDAPTVSMIWDQLGYELLIRGRLEEAEQALLEAFRLRRLNRLEDVKYSYYTLGMLRLAQGDAVSAGRLLDESIARLSHGAGTLALWRVYFERGRARMQSGRLVDALQDFEKALDLATRLRFEVLPAESVWINTGADRNRLCSELIRAASTLYFQSKDAAYARMAFEALEENRATGLRALIYSPTEWRKQLPPEYWETLARLRSAETALLHENGSPAKSELSHLQYRLTEMEAEAGLSLSLSAMPGVDRVPGLVERVRGSLQPGDAFFSFHLDEPYSLLWVVTREDFAMLRLPARGQISALAEEFRNAVRLGLPEGVASGEQLYTTLFGAAPSHILAKRQWALALDGDLFRLPLAALVTGRPGGRPEYLAERHAAVIVPSALLLSRQHTPAWEGPFVGVGDPIYNAADSRGDSRAERRLLAYGGFLDMLPPVFAETRKNQAIELARLPGSGRELEACSRAWQPDASRSVLLTGSGATLSRLEEAFSLHPSILHFAVHFLRSAGDTRQALMALSLGPDGSPELLGLAEVSRKRLDRGLVVLSGCTSAGAETLPAEGLMGMTRAWLAAGADSVLATLWPTPDDQGRLLVSFYAHLAKLQQEGDNWAVAEALRRAQVDMLHSGTWHESSGYWGAYLLAGKE